MKVVVTGGAGYVGSVIACKLLEQGNEVVVIDNLSRGHRDAVPDKALFIKADITDFGSVIKSDDNVDAVIHCASFISVAESMKNPELYWENNTVKSLLLLRAMEKLGIRNIVFSSTAAVYGEPEKAFMIDENCPAIPNNVYGMTKLATDKCLKAFAETADFACISFRYFNVGGAYKAYGERHKDETHIIPLALKAAETDRPVFKVFGNNYDTPDGTCIRDYIHVSDLADAHLLALNAFSTGKHNIFNLGNGKGYSNLEIVKTVAKVTGKKFEIIYGEPRTGDPAVLVASHVKASNILGWKSKFSLEEIVSDSMRFSSSRK